MESSERKGGEQQGKLPSPQRICNYEQNVGRNMDDKSYYDEFSDENEKHVIGNQRKADPCYKVTENLAALCSCQCFMESRTCEQ